MVKARFLKNLQRGKGWFERKECYLVDIVVEIYIYIYVYIEYIYIIYDVELAH